VLKSLNLYRDAVSYYDRIAPLIPSQPNSIYLARLLKAAAEAIGPGDPQKAADLLRLGIDMYSELEAPLLVATAQVYLASTCVVMGNADEGSRLCEAAQLVLEGSNFTRSRIRALKVEGLIATIRNETTRAKRLYYRALELSRSSGMTDLSTSTTMEIALVEYVEGNFTEAVEMGRLAVESILSTRHNRLLCISITNQSIYLCMAGRLAEARPMAEQALPLAHAAGGWSVLACILGWVLLLGSEGHHREAAQLFGFLLEGNARAGIATLSYQDRTYERIRAIFADNLSPDELSASMEIGAAWTEDQAIAFALQSGNAGASGLGALVLD
jgi:tetratricopeptide (TPR) repeat protein